MHMPMFRRLLIPVALAALVAPGVVPVSSADDPFPPLPLRFVVAEVGGERLADRGWIDARVGWANRIFEAAGVSFETHRVEPLAAEHARLETRRDRHALGTHVQDGVINVFVVASLRDVDDPSRYRMGVHWRPRGHPGKHLVIVTAEAGATVLSHELGHFFGNRRHSDTPGNIMSYDRGDVPPFFDAVQIRRIRHHARRFLHTGELVPNRNDPSGTSHAGG